MGARETALGVLIACRKDGAWSNGVLKEYIRHDGLDAREAALASRLCYGVLQNRGKLDFYLRQLLTGKLKDLHPAVRDILHLGLYQILEMNKIPESAAVNESVKLAKKHCAKVRSAPGLVNAVLRNALRSKDQLQQPQSLADRYSHPKKLIDMLGAYVGQERLEGMLAANNAAVPTVVQVNTLRTTTQALKENLQASGIDAQGHPWLTDCLVLTGTGDMEKLDAFQKGLFYVQDAAARLSVLCAGLQPGWQVLDCCSAPGGKSFAAAIAMGGRGSITSCDIHPHKLPLIEKSARRLGFENIATRHQDATQLVPEWEGAMDCVIADVPCSGLGIIRKKPDIRYKDLKETGELPALQKKILTVQSRYVRPGGVLIYSTCTVLKRENEEVVASFLEENSDFYTEPLALPERFGEDTTGMLTLIPGQHDTDGFFICRLRRKP